MTQCQNKHTPSPIFDDLAHMQRHVTPLIVTQNTANIPQSATRDYQLAFDFIYSYRGSQATFNAYRRELERLLTWSWFVAKKSLAELDRHDIEAWVTFCQHPPLQWIGSTHVSRYITQQGLRVPNPAWRPFIVKVSKKQHKNGDKAEPASYALSQNAIQAIFSIAGSFFNFLIHEEYLRANPVAQVRQKSKFLRKYQGSRPVRRLSETQWAYVIQTATALAEIKPLQHERTLFIMSALFGMYLRISELAATDHWEPKMSDFMQDTDGMWWFRTVGKGNKERTISVSEAMLASLKRYRLSLGLDALPSPDDITPLIPKIRGRGAINTTRQIRKIVQNCFDQAISKLRNDGLNEDAELLMSATVHWLRHTGISEDVKSRPREHVRDDAGHSSSAITDRYIDIELRERHLSARKKRIKPED